MTERRWMLSLFGPTLIVVEGAGVGTYNGTYQEGDEQNGRVAYEGFTVPDGYFIRWNPSPAQWEIGLVLGTPSYFSAEDVMSPLQVTTWTASPGFDPAPTVSLYTANTYTTQVYPANTADVRFVQEQDLEGGQIFFRTKLNTDLVFGGVHRKADWDRFWTARQKQPCRPYYIRMEERQGGLWRVIWTGRFAAAGGNFDLDDCLFRVRPDVVDRYTCLLAAMDRKVNILRIEPLTTKVINIPALEWGCCIQTFSLLNCTDFYDGFSMLRDEWTVAHSQTEVDCTAASWLLGVYWRERLVTECVGGNPVPPPGSGWVLLENNCVLNGTATYVRNSTISYTFGAAVPGTFADGNPIPPDDTCVWQYVGAVEPNPFCPGLIPYFVCLSAGASTSYTRSRNLQDAAEFILRQTGCLLSGVSSDLLEWDPIGDAPGYAPGINYVTGGANQINHLTVLQKSDAIDPAATNPATIGEMTMKELLLLLNVAFQAFWDIDDDGVLRIEHYTYWTEPIGLDLGTVPDAVQPLAFAPKRETTPKQERAVWMEAQGRDFIGADILYSGPCVSDEAGVKEYTAGRITTDIAFVDNDPDAISKDGFVVLATAFDGADYLTILGTGAISGNVITNAPMSWANLQAAFWLDNRYLPTGKMNNELSDFGIRTTILQSQVRVPCQNFRLWDPRKRVAGALADRLGLDAGVVEKAEWNPARELLTLTIGYPFM